MTVLSCEAQAAFDTSPADQRGARETSAAPAHAPRVELYGYQCEALGGIVAGIGSGGRGKLLMFCGTGKTLVAIRAAAVMVPARGIVVWACPTLELVSQTLGVWSTDEPAHQALAVCSDETVADGWTTSSDLPCPVTTDADQAVTWLQGNHGEGLRVVMTTHASLDRVAEALRHARLRAGLTVVDEAHWTAGKADKATTVVHDEDLFPSDRRLYMTATPRVFTGSRTGAAEIVSMDDPVFGSTLYDYPAGRAIAEGSVSDYRIAVVGVRHHDALRLLQRLPSRSRPSHADPVGTALRRAVVQTALGRAMTAFDLRRVLVFTSRVAEAKAVAATMLRHLTVSEGTDADDDIDTVPVTASFVSGAMPARERQDRLRLLANPPGDGRTVLANARCLAEGVNLPEIDGVCLMSRSESTAHIVQAVGRAMRLHRDRPDPAIVLVPVLLPDTAPNHATPTALDGHSVDGAMDAGEVSDMHIPDLDDGWALLWQVLRALRTQDDSLAAELDAARLSLAKHPRKSCRPPSRLVFDLPDSHQHLLDHIVVKLLRSTYSPWWDGYGAACRYYERTGHLDMESRYRDPDTGYPVGSWVTYQQTCARNGWLSTERDQLLRKIGFTAKGKHRTKWEIFLAHCDRYLETHPHLNVPQKYVDPTTGYPLGRRISNYRQRGKANYLEPERRAELDARNMVWNGHDHDWWNVWLPLLADYRSTHGHCRVLATYRSPGPESRALGNWLQKQISKARNGQLAASQATALRKLGVDLP